MTPRGLVVESARAIAESLGVTMHIRKPWIRWDDGVDPREIPGAMGVYELADADRKTLYIGKAGGHSPYGLRGELFRNLGSADLLAGANWSHPRMGERLHAVAGAVFYRFEVNHQYYGRWIEALTRYLEDYEELPPGNVEDTEPMPRLGRYHWKSAAVAGGAAGTDGDGDGDGA